MVNFCAPEHVPGPPVGIFGREAATGQDIMYIEPDVADAPAEPAPPPTPDAAPTDVVPARGNGEEGAAREPRLTALSG